MDFGRFLSVRRLKPDHESKGKEGPRRYLPLLGTPVNKDLHLALGSSGDLNLEKLKSRPDSIDSISTTSSGNPILYKSHHEASTIELFYDLFFVANLAYFTAMHQHVDAVSVINYLKLFTLLWFTWLSTILFDVRFISDSIYMRFCKMVHFGVMAGFTFAGPVFDIKSTTDDQRYYRAFAMVLFTSRIMIAIQYGVVMWQSRRFKKALLPLGLTAGVYLITAFVFLATKFISPATGPVQWYEIFIWFTVSIAEGLATMLIAIFYRIISFKYTHLVERMGLLSIIIIGEGIIGMVKSVSCVTKGQLDNNGAEIGTIVAAVILLYLCWMLYFDQIDDDRFGTIRQQIWALLHFPLHVAILLLVEGNTSLIVWNSVVQGLKFVWRLREPLPRFDPAATFATSEAFITYFNDSMVKIDKHFTTYSWSKAYDWNKNITAIANASSTYDFKSDAWNQEVHPIINRAWTSAAVFIFEAHKETMDKMLAVMPKITDTESTLKEIYAVFDVVVLYFFVCAGGTLLVLAVMYWFGKLHKTKYEFGEMIVRTIVGFTIPVIGVTATLTNKSETGFKFAASNWLIPIVLLAYLIVLGLDNVLLTFAHHGEKRKSLGGGGRYSRSRSNEDDEDDDRTPMVDDSNFRVARAWDQASKASRSSVYNPRNTTYEPYDTYQATRDRATSGASKMTTPELRAPRSRSASRGPSRTGSPGPNATPQIPVSMIMQNNFRPSHARTRSAGYAQVQSVEDEEYDDAGKNFVNTPRVAEDNYLHGRDTRLPGDERV